MTTPGMDIAKWGLAIMFLGIFLGGMVVMFGFLWDVFTGKV